MVTGDHSGLERLRRWHLGFPVFDYPGDLDFRGTRSFAFVFSFTQLSKLYFREREISGARKAVNLRLVRKLATEPDQTLGQVQKGQNSQGHRVQHDQGRGSGKPDRRQPSLILAHGNPSVGQNVGQLRLPNFFIVYF